MLKNYRIVVVLSGHRSIQILGPLANRGQNDVSLLQEFMTLPGGSAQPRGAWIMGSGFGESETVDHSSFLSSFMRATLRNPDYASLTGNSSPTIDLIVQPPVAPGSPRNHGVLSNSLDVFTVVVAAPSGQVGAYYENVGAGGPFIGSVYAPNSGGARPVKTILDGFAVSDLTDGYTGPTRREYVYDALTSALGDLACTPFFCIPQCIGVPPHGGDSAFLSLASNPARGAASIRLVMPKTERAKVAIYDVTGRRLKTLADGLLAEGPQSFVWDGTDGSGAPEAAGVYWVRVGTTSGMRASKTFVLLR